MPRRHLFVYALTVVSVIGLLLGAAVPRTGAAADEQQWLIGTWELSYDPDGHDKDQLIFKPNGDVISRGADGKQYEGMYIVTPQGVKTVFTHEGQDVIATFYTDKQRQALKIVTSQSGEESVYKKVD